MWKKTFCKTSSANKFFATEKIKIKNCKISIKMKQEDEEKQLYN